MKCKVYANGKSVEVCVDSVFNVLEHWYIDPGILLEKVKNYMGISNVEFRDMKMYGRYSVKKNQLIIGYLVKDQSKHEHEIFIVCAENPDELYAKTQIEKSNWRDYGQYVYYKAIILGNFVNKEGIKEFEEAFWETVELLNDLIDVNPLFYCREAGDSEKLKELSIRSAFQFALNNIAFPLASAIFHDLIGGTPVACFMQLRLILEALVKSLAVDYDYRFKDISVESIAKWEEYTKRGDKARRTYFRNIIESLRNSGLLSNEAYGDAEELWKRLSEEWVHFRGYASKIIKRVLERKRALEYVNKLTDAVPTIPPYMWVMPIDVDSDLEPELRDLYECVSKLRKLLREIYDAWLKLATEYDAEFIKKCYKQLK